MKKGKYKQNTKLINEKKVKKEKESVNEKERDEMNEWKVKKEKMIIK